MLIWVNNLLRLVIYLMDLVANIAEENAKVKNEGVILKK